MAETRGHPHYTANTAICFSPAPAAPRLTQQLLQQGPRDLASHADQAGTELRNLLLQVPHLGLV